MRKLNIFVLLFICLVTTECSQTYQKETIMIIIPEIPKEKQIIYGIEQSIFYPYELYINNIKADFSSNGGNPPVEINPYVLKNGKYKIKLVLFPYEHEKILTPEAIKKNTLQFVKIIRKNKDGDLVSRETLKLLPLNIPNKSIEIYEQEWEVEINELPYELEGWSKGQDLSKMDKKVLENKVVTYYQRLWKVLNEGNGAEWTKLVTKRQYETAIFNYSTKDEYENIIIENRKIIEEKCKGMMTPFEDYIMMIYGEGKLVTLERKSHTQSFNNENRMDIKGWSPLIRKYKISGGEEYSVLLYLPQDSNEFVIIRK